jgi:hypothetical protein
MICGWADNSNFIRLETSGSLVVNGYSVGGICGYASGGSIVNCTNLADVQNTNVSTDSEAGGICGYASGNKILNSINRGNINGSIAGGIVGEADYSVTLSNCCNYSNVHGSEKAGGIGINGHPAQVYISSSNSYQNCFWLYEAAENIGIEDSGYGFYNKASNYSSNGHFVRSDSRCQLEDGSDLVEALNQWVDDNDTFPSIYSRWEYKVGSDGFAYPVLK